MPNGLNRFGGHDGRPPRRLWQLVAQVDGREVGSVQVHDRAVWRKFELKPHLTDGFMLSPDPLFVDEVVDVGLYHNPPEKVVVL